MFYFEKKNYSKYSSKFPEIKSLNLVVRYIGSLKYSDSKSIKKKPKNSHARTPDLFPEKLDLQIYFNWIFLRKT